MCIYIYIYITAALKFTVQPEQILTPGLHNKTPALKTLARGWVAQEPICLHYQR